MARLPLAACLVAALLTAACTRTSTPETTAATAAAENPANLPFWNSSLPLADRVHDLVSRLTLDEKAAQMQMDAPAIPRLGIPAYHWWNEALHGIARNGEATVFPQAIGLAATWDPALHRKMGETIALETRVKHAEAARLGITAIYTGLDLWSPNINIFRDPRWGRGQETYGEDPFLTSRFAVAYIRGVQEGPPQPTPESQPAANANAIHYFPAIATPKHFAVHSGPEPERHRFDPDPSPQDLRTTYLPAFEAAIREGHAYSIMAAYNSINGFPAAASPHLLDDILRKEWGFEGYVVSDVDSVRDVWENHQFVGTPEEATAAAVKAGCDLNSGTTYAVLADAVHAGLLSEADVDKCVTRLMTARFRLGLFDPPDMVPLADLPPGLNDTKDHDALALKLAEESLVLLKNADNTLPLDRSKIKTLAVIGPNADSQAVLLGNYNGTPARPVTILQGLRDNLAAAGANPDARVLYAPGCPIVEEQLPLEETIPAWALYTDDTKKTPGLLASYYPTAADSRPARTRIDPTLDFDWALQADRDPVPVTDPDNRTGAGNNEMFARWTTTLVPPESGEYTIGLDGRDAFRLYVDDEVVIDEWTLGGKRTHAARIALQKGQPVHLTVEYYHAPPDTGAPAAGAVTATPSTQPRTGRGGTGRGGGRRAATTNPAGGRTGQTARANAFPPLQPRVLRSDIRLAWTRPAVPNMPTAAEAALADAARIAESADATILVLGLTADLEREEHDIDFNGFFGGDRTAIELPPVQQQLLERVAETAAKSKKPLIVVLTAGSALAIPYANQHVPAILDAWYPGQDGGKAVAEALFGDINPSGHLPVTFYNATADLPDFSDYTMAPSEHNPGRTYRYFTGKPLYPFGYGLSYTTFALENLSAPAQSATDQNLSVAVAVKNTGPRAGDAVAQLYLSPDGSPKDLPHESLVAFQRVALAPNESKTVHFTVTPYQLATIDKDGKRITAPGPLHLHAALSSDLTGAPAANVTLTGQATTPPYAIVAPTLETP